MYDPTSRSAVVALILIAVIFVASSWGKGCKKDKRPLSNGCVHSLKMITLESN